MEESFFSFWSQFKIKTVILYFLNRAVELPLFSAQNVQNNEGKLVLLSWNKKLPSTPFFPQRLFITHHLILPLNTNPRQ